MATLRAAAAAASFKRAKLIGQWSTWIVSLDQSASSSKKLSISRSPNFLSENPKVETEEILEQNHKMAEKSSIFRLNLCLRM